MRNKKKPLIPLMIEGLGELKCRRHFFNINRLLWQEEFLNYNQKIEGDLFMINIDKRIAFFCIKKRKEYNNGD